MLLYFNSSTCTHYGPPVTQRKGLWPRPIRAAIGLFGIGCACLASLYTPGLPIYSRPRNPSSLEARQARQGSPHLLLRNQAITWCQTRHSERILNLPAKDSPRRHSHPRGFVRRGDTKSVYNTMTQARHPTPMLPRPARRGRQNLSCRGGSSGL